MLLLKISSLVFYTSDHTLFQTKMGITALWPLLCSTTEASFGTYFISAQQLAHLSCSSHNISTASWHTVQLKSLKTASCFQLKVSGMENNPKSYPVLMNAPPSQRPHMLSLSHITTIFWNWFHSQYLGLQLLLENFWI